MKKLYVLCLVTLAALLLQIALLRSGSVSAQVSTQYEVKSIQPNIGSINVAGTVVGFSCVQSASDTTICYVLSAR